MGELVLHIGLPKTGTSSLQRFFSLNRKQLADHGVGFPVFSKQPTAPQIRNGYFLNHHCSNLAKGLEPHSKINDFEENLKRLSKRLATRDRILLSEECTSLRKQACWRNALSRAVLANPGASCKRSWSECRHDCRVPSASRFWIASY